MDGHALAERLRTLPGMETLRIVAVTGYGEQSYRRRSRTAGFDRHLVKPIDLTALERMLRAWMVDEAERG
jgi:CheY-like chemotaxis protein